MTSNTLDELRKLSAKVMQEAQDKADVYRPDDRPVLTEFTAMTRISLETKSGLKQDGEGWSQQVVRHAWTGINPIETHRNVPTSITELQYDVNMAQRINSQLGLEIKSIAVATGNDEATILDIDGRVVHYKEIAIPAPKHRGQPKTIKRSDGTMITLNDGDTAVDRNGYRLKPTFYYSVVEIQGAKAEADPADNAQLVSAALAFATGKTSGEFRQGVVGYLKEQNIVVSDTEQLYLISRMIPDMTKAGRLGLDDDKKFILL